MMLKSYFFLIPAYLLTINIPLQGLQIGSDTNLTVEGAVFFTGTGNSIEGLAFVDGGMSLQDGATTVSFDSTFKVDGPIDLNSGSLYLQRDMKLSSVARFGTGGSIYGNNHSVRLPHLNQALSFPTGTPSFGAPLDLVTTFTDLTQLVLDMSWSGDGKYLAVVRCGSSPISSLEIYYFNGVTLELMATMEKTYPLLYESLHWHPTEYVLATLFLNYNPPVGYTCEVYRFFPSNSVNQRLQTSATLTFDSYPIGGLHWSPDGTKLGFIRVSSTGFIGADVYSFEANDTFVLKPSVLYSQFLPGHSGYIFGASRSDHAAWDPSSSYFISTVYDYNFSGPPSDPSGNRIIIFYDNDLVVTPTLVIPLEPFNGFNFSMSWMHTGSSIAISTYITGIFMYTYDANNGSLTLVNSIPTTHAQAVDFNPHDTVVLASLQNFDPQTGGFSGGTQELQLINYDSFSGDFSRAAIVTTNNLYSGRSSDVQPIARWSSSNVIATSAMLGTDRLSSTLFIYKLHEMKDFTFDTTTLSCGSDVVMTGSCTFSGSCILNGGGHTLDLSSMGHLVVAHDSTLSLKNIIIKGFGLQPDQLVFQDTTSVLKLSNVVIEFDNNVTTTIGSIFVDGPVSLVLKDHLWTIDGQATLTIDGMTVRKEKGSAPTSGTVIFGEPTSNYCTLLNKGALKEYADGELLIDTSNALIRVENIITDNSNAIIDLWQSVCDCDLIVDTSNAIAAWSELTYDMSNVVESLSQALGVLNGIPSSLVIDTSNAVAVFAENECDCQLVVDTSDAIVKWSDLMHDTSNAIEGISHEVPGVMSVNNQLVLDNSNAITVLAEHACDCEVIVDNSNAAMYWKGVTQDASNALESVSHEISSITNQLVIDSSNAIVLIAEDECDCSLVVDTSDAIASLAVYSELVIDTSNAIVHLADTLQDMSGINNQLVIDMSNAIVVVAENACDCELIVDNSNAIVTWAELTKETSDAVLATPGVVTNQLIIDTSNALVSLVESLLDGNDIIITTTTQLTKSMFMQPGQRVLVTGDVTLDGGGATVVFAASPEAQFVIRTGSTLRLRNIELLNIHATTIDLQKGATLIIERNVVWELVEDITLSQGLVVIIGDTPNTCVVRGNGNRKLTLKPASSYFAPSNTPVLLDLGSNALRLENVELVGLEYITQSPVTQGTPFGGIMLAGNAYVQVEGTTDINILVYSLGNVVNLTDKSTQLDGRILFDDHQTSELRINCLQSVQGEAVQIAFGPSCVLVSSLTGQARLLFTNQQVSIVNKALDSCVLGNNAFLGEHTINVTGNPIKQIVQSVSFQSGLVVQSDTMPQPIEIEINSG